MTKNLIWTSEKVEKFWTEVGGSPLDDLAFSKVAGKDLFARVKPYLPEDTKTVIDFGAGAGHFTKILADNGYKVGIYEPSRDIILPEVITLENVKWINPDQDNEPVDIIFCLEMIEHVLDEELELFFWRIKKLLKPGGTIVVSTPHQENMEYAKVYCVESDTFFHPWQHVRSFSGKQLVELLNAYGFKKEVIGIDDFSSLRETYIELQSLRAQVGGFMNIFNYMLNSSKESKVELMTDQMRDDFTAMFDHSTEALKSHLKSDFVILNNNLNEMVRKIETNPMIAGGDSEAVIKAVEEVNRHSNEFERMSKEDPDEMDISSGKLIHSAQNIANKAMGVASHIAVASAIRKHKALSDIFSEITVELELFLRKTKELQFRVHNFLPFDELSNNTLKFPDARIGSLSEQELREVVTKVYFELSSRKLNTGKTTNEFDFEFGSGTTLVYIGRMEG